MIHITHEGIKLGFKLIAGISPLTILDKAPFEIYRKDVINFLDRISKELIKKNSNDNYLNFKGFGFWSRKANLLKLKSLRNDINKRYGRGPTLHIAPSNIASNAMYTFAFGLLSGCPSIIRLSEKNIQEFGDIIKLIKTLSELDEFTKLKNIFSFISYEHDDNLNNYFSSRVKSRVIWGGDQTVNLFKSFKSSPHCIDLVFPNKVSTSIVSNEWLISSDKVELRNKADSYARDIGLFSQMACSSPLGLIILKDCKENYCTPLKEFLTNCDELLNKKDWLPENHALSNFKTSIDICLKFPEISCLYKGNNLSAFLVPKEKFDIFRVYKPQDASLFVFEVSEIDEVINLLSENNQTIVCIGINEEIKKEISKKAILQGTNRVVNAGNALNMNIYWDGYDIVSSLSKLISNI